MICPWSVWNLVLGVSLALGPAVASSEPQIEEETAVNNPEGQVAPGERPHVNGRTPPFAAVNYIPQEVNSTRNTEWNIEKQEKIADGSKEDRDVLETQHATCQVTTEELVATAQATVTRVMKGLCNAREMDKRFKSLETLVEAEVNGLKAMMMNLEDRLADQNEMVLKGQKQINLAISKSCEGGESDLEKRLSRLTQPSSGTFSKLGEFSSEAGEPAAAETGTRDSEIVKYNSSIHFEQVMGGGTKKVFTYYWKVQQMNYMLMGWNPRRSLRSQSFYIFPNGYRMYLRVHPRQDEDNFYIHVGVTQGEFDNSLPWPFPLKHRVHILDQTKEGRMFEDIASRVWDPTQLCSEFNWQKPTKGDNYECVGLGFPHDVLHQRDYIRNDIIVIKLTVYLE